MRDIEKLIKDITSICKKLKISYVIVGAVSVSTWGNIRATRDVDIIFSLEKPKIKSFVKGLKSKNFIVREDDIKDALIEKSHFTIFDKLSSFFVDGKGVYTKNDNVTLKNRKKIKLDRFEIYVNSPEDLIPNKLLFGSEQDIKDAESVFVRQFKELDIGHLEKRCKELRVYKRYLKLKRKVEKIVGRQV